MTISCLTEINPIFMMLLPVLYAIAEIIKMTPLKRWLIPFILWGISIFLTTILLFISKISLQNVFTGIIQGTLFAMMTVGGNQFYKQATEKRFTDTDNNNKLN